MTFDLDRLVHFLFNGWQVKGLSHFCIRMHPNGRPQSSVGSSAIVKASAYHHQTFGNAFTCLMEEKFVELFTKNARFKAIGLSPLSSWITIASPPPTVILMPNAGPLACYAACPTVIVSASKTSSHTFNLKNFSLTKSFHLLSKAIDFQPQFTTRGDFYSSLTAMIVFLITSNVMMHTVGSPTHTRTHQPAIYCWIPKCVKFDLICSNKCCHDKFKSTFPDAKLTESKKSQPCRQFLICIQFPHKVQHKSRKLLSSRNVFFPHFHDAAELVIFICWMLYIIVWIFLYSFKVRIPSQSISFRKAKHIWSKRKVSFKMQQPWSAVLLALAASLLQAETLPELRITQGMIRGVRQRTESGQDFVAFLGIPFALPPTGHLRFQVKI